MSTHLDPWQRAGVLDATKRRECKKCGTIRTEKPSVPGANNSRTQGKSTSGPVTVTKNDGTVTVQPTLAPGTLNKIVTASTRRAKRRKSTDQ